MGWGRGLVSQLLVVLIIIFFVLSFKKKVNCCSSLALFSFFKFNLQKITHFFFQLSVSQFEMASNCDPQGFIGPYTQEQNISISAILNPNSLEDQPNLNNGIVYEIRKNSSSDGVAAETISKLGQKNEAIQNKNFESLRKKIQLTYNKIKLLRRKGNAEALHNYCQLTFTPPLSKHQNVDDSTKDIIKEVTEKIKDVKKENNYLKRGLDEKEYSNQELKFQIEKLEKVSNVSLDVLKHLQIQHRNAIAKFSADKSLLEKETNKWQKKFEQTSESLDNTTNKLEEAKIKLSKYNPRNVNKRQKRLQDKYVNTLSEKQLFEVQLEQKSKEVNDHQQNLNKKEEELQKHVKNLDSSKEKVTELKSEKHKLQKRLCGLKISLNKTKCSLVTQHEDEICDLKEQINLRNKKITELQQLNVLLESDQIKTFENGRYVNEVRECIMSLLTECNVSMNKVNGVISTVLKKMTGVLPARLPSMAVKSRLLVEAKSVAQQQIVEAMLKDSDPTSLVGNTLHSDATSKFFKHYQSFQVTLSDGKVMSIGMSEVGRGDVNSLMESFTSIVNELADSCTKYEIEKDVKVAKLITSITNTMSDQGSVNPVFNSALSEMRSELLPVVIKNWFNLSDATQANLRSMGNFFLQNAPCS